MNELVSGKSSFWAPRSRTVINLQRQAALYTDQPIFLWEQLTPTKPGTLLALGADHRGVWRRGSWGSHLVTRPRLTLFLQTFQAAKLGHLHLLSFDSSLEGSRDVTELRLHPPVPCH